MITFSRQEFVKKFVSSNYEFNYNQTCNAFCAGEQIEIEKGEKFNYKKIEKGISKMKAFTMNKI